MLMSRLRESHSSTSKTENHEIESTFLSSSPDNDRVQRQQGSFVSYSPGKTGFVQPCEIIYVEKSSRQIGIACDRQKEETLRDFTMRLINAQEEERSRLARELHDDLSQRMALLSFNLAQIGQMLAGQSNLRRDFQTVQDEVQEIAADIHRLSYRLHPSKLDHLGLSAAIRSLCQEINATGKPVVDFREEGSFVHLPKEVILCVFRIAQESLRNCVKHSGAKSVRVMLTNTGGEIRLSVSDDGRGFKIKSETLERGLGFTSMRERLRIVGGTFVIRSQQRLGTSIEVSVPLTCEGLVS